MLECIFDKFGRRFYRSESVVLFEALTLADVYIVEAFCVGHFVNRYAFNCSYCFVFHRCLLVSGSCLSLVYILIICHIGVFVNSKIAIFSYFSKKLKSLPRSAMISGGGG